MKIGAFCVSLQPLKFNCTMEYSKLISASGLSGLFEIVTSKNDGAIARSLENNTTQFISSRTHQFSHLESIEVYTTHDNINLAELFLEMEKSKESLPDEKDAKAIVAYFKKVYPKLDFERVYNSDMKKMVKWFAQIKKHGIKIELTSQEEE
jgi:hypothetical protein